MMSKLSKLEKDGRALTAMPDKVDWKIIEAPRRVIRLRMIRDRENKYGKCLCDFCNKRIGTEMHEIITRYRTVNNPEMRKKSFHPYICSILCSECHHEAPVTSIIGHKRIFAKLKDLYGENKVRTILAGIPPEFRRNIYFD